MKLLRSLSFRLALLYAVIFCLSVAGLGALYYGLAIRGPLESVRSGLKAEGRDYSALYSARGGDVLALLLEQRAGQPSQRMAYHALLDQNGNAVTANLPSWPHAHGGNWIRIEADVAREGDEDEYEALVFDQMLDDGGRLLIGRDIEDLDELEEGIKDTLIWLIPALLILALVVGALMSRAIGRRVEAVSSAARKVMAGDLAERIALRGSGDDFDQLGETLNLMLDRIGESLDAVRRVSDGVAHELRTPLTRLQASLAELQTEADLPAVAEAIDEAERLQGIFDAVLRISRVEAVRHGAPAGPVDLSALLADAVELYLPAAEARGQTLAATVPEGLVVRGDRDLLFQAFANLIDNAVKFAPDGGRIAVAASRQAGGIGVAVEDNGPGIAVELRERVTERFFRAPEAEGRPGLGLGLALVSAAAAFHQSSLAFVPAEPGLRVEWLFPAAMPTSASP